MMFFQYIFQADIGGLVELRGDVFGEFCFVRFLEVESGCHIDTLFEKKQFFTFEGALDSTYRGDWG